MNRRERKIIVEFAKTLKEASAENDPWAVRDEIAKKVEAVAKKIEQLDINENAFMYGNLADRQKYQREILGKLGKLHSTWLKFTNDVNYILNKSSK